MGVKKTVRDESVISGKSLEYTRIEFRKFASSAWIEQKLSLASSQNFIAPWVKKSGGRRGKRNGRSMPGRPNADREGGRKKANIEQCLFSKAPSLSSVPWF